MNKRFLILISVIIGAFTFSSCSKKTNTEGRYIPQKAAFVLHINGSSINQKLPWDEVKNTGMVKRLMEDSSLPEKARAILINPESGGVNIKNDAAVFYLKDSLGGYIGIAGKLSNADAFDKLARNESKGDFEFSENSGVQSGKGKGMGLAWNKDRFLFVVGVPNTTFPDKFNNMQLSSEDSTGKVIFSATDNRNYGQLAFQVFNIKESESLGDNEKFSELVADKADLHFWVNSEEIYNMQSAEMPAIGPLNMLNFTKFTKDARSTASVNFDNGKISVDFRAYMNKEVADIFKKNMVNHTDAEMIKRISPENLAMIMQFSIKPQIIKEYLKLLGADGFANMGTGMLGFSIDDLIDANKGDYLLAVSDIKVDSAKPKFDYLFSTSIASKTAFDKVMTGVSRMMKMYFNSSDSSSTSANAPLSYNKSEKYFALGSSQPLVDGYLTGSKTYSSPVYDKITTGPGGGYINFAYIMNAVTPLVNDSSTQEMLAASKLIWKDMISYTENFSGNSVHGHMDINLVNNDSNSLKQLNHYFDAISTILINKKKKEDITYNMLREAEKNN